MITTYKLHIADFAKGWLRLLHHCFTMVSDLESRRQIIDCASRMPNLLTTCCSLLLVPSHILPVYLPCLEKVMYRIANRHHNSQLKLFLGA